MAAGSTGAAPGDALEILAIRTAECLDGGRAAILRPERRRRLLRIAHMLGVGQFDANLVFAIVQDNARRGAMPESAAQDARLSVLAPRRQRREVSAAAWIIPQVIGALGIAALMLFALIRWISG
jgi:hypothetical protein